MTLIALPDAPAVPSLRFRHYRGEEDHPGMLRVYMAVHDHDGLEDVLTLDQLKLNYETLVNCDPARDMVLAEVDTDSPTGATALYESLGFAPEKTFTTYRKPL